MVGVFVVGRTLEYGLGRMFQILGEEELSYRTHVCYTLEEARAWIAAGDQS